MLYIGSAAFSWECHWTLASAQTCIGPCYYSHNSSLGTKFVFTFQNLRWAFWAWQSQGISVWPPTFCCTSAGSTRVGKIIMSAAAKNLTPLTLELGGKSPCYVDACCNFQNAANRIVWGKFFNAGQTCIAPDYVLCTIETQERLMPCLRQAIREFYGNEPQDSPDFGRMVNEKEFRRVRALLDSGRMAIGGQTDECDLYIGEQVVWCGGKTRKLTYRLEDLLCSVCVRRGRQKGKNALCLSIGVESFGAKQGCGMAWYGSNIQYSISIKCPDVNFYPQLLPCWLMWENGSQLCKRRSLDPSCPLSLCQIWMQPSRSSTAGIAL